MDDIVLRFVYEGLVRSLLGLELNLFPKNISWASPLGLAAKNNCGGHTAPKPGRDGRGVKVLKICLQKLRNY